MFTTGISVADHGLVQRIGASWSPDLITWRRNPRRSWRPTSVGTPLERTGIARLTGVILGSFRQAGSGTWWRRRSQRLAGTAVVAHAVSPDLVGWEVRPPLSLPSRRFGWAEVITVMPVLGPMGTGVLLHAGPDAA